MADKIPVYVRRLSFGGGLDEYDVYVLTLDEEHDYTSHKLVGYLLPLEEKEQTDDKN